MCPQEQNLSWQTVQECEYGLSHHPPTILERIKRIHLRGFIRALFKDHPSSPQLDNLYALQSVDKDITCKRSRSGQGQGKFKGLIVDANYYLNCIPFLHTKMMPTSALVAKDTTKRRKQKCGLDVMSRRITGGTIVVLDITESHQQNSLLLLFVQNQ